MRCITRNYPVVMGAVLVTTALYVLATLLADLRPPGSTPVSAPASEIVARRGAGASARRRLDALRRLLRDPLGALGLALVLLFVLTRRLGALARALRARTRSTCRTGCKAPSARALARHRQSRPRRVLARHLRRAHRAGGGADRRSACRLPGGIVLGLIAGYGPRWLDSILMLLFDSVARASDGDVRARP